MNGINDLNNLYDLSSVVTLNQIDLWVKIKRVKRDRNQQYLETVSTDWDRIITTTCIINISYYNTFYYGKNVAQGDKLVAL